MGNQAFRVRKEAPFRADIVGSFLRPEAIKQAREAHASGAITQQELTVVEDAHIRDLVQKQKEAGLQCITDREFRPFRRRRSATQSFCARATRAV